MGNIIVTRFTEGVEMLSDMEYGGDYNNRLYDKIKRKSGADSPYWLQKAVQQKNPRLTLDLAYSILLVYDDLDEKILSLTGFN